MRNIIKVAIGVVISAGVIVPSAVAQEVSSLSPDQLTQIEQLEQQIRDIRGAEVLATFNTVCGSSAVLSDAARTACDDNTPPTIVVDGSRFSNRGVGAEFNVLARNIDAFSVVTE